MTGVRHRAAVVRAGLRWAVSMDWAYSRWFLLCLVCGGDVFAPQVGGPCV